MSIRWTIQDRADPKKVWKTGGPVTYKERENLKSLIEHVCPSGIINKKG